MSTDGYDTHAIHTLDPDKAVRLRPAMYVGSVNYFGFINYVVQAFQLMIRNGATWIEFESTDAMHITSDAVIALQPDHPTGFAHPDEVQLPVMILVGLSKEMRLEVDDGTHRMVQSSRWGEKQPAEWGPSHESGPRCHVEMQADGTILQVTGVPPAVVIAYLRRNACLHPSIEFRVRQGGEVRVFASRGGVRDLFESFSLPFQVLHTPVHIHEVEGDLRVELVCALHSWSENLVISFMNKGRVIDGGTHEAGMYEAIGTFYNTLRYSSPAGLLAVLAVESPRVSYLGCVKARVASPELRPGVRRLVSRGLRAWAKQNPEELKLFAYMERFQFPDIWG